MNGKNKNTAKSGSRPGQSRQTGKKAKQSRIAQKRSISVPVAFASPMKANKPRIVPFGKEGNIIVTHREWISNISAVNADPYKNLFQYALNPGQNVPFGWLSNIAQCYEKYRWRKLRFFYKTRCSSATAGSVYLAPEYDASDIGPFSEQIVSNYSDTVEDAPWKDQTCILNPSKLHPNSQPLYVRLGAVPLGGDIKTYDAGKLIVGTADCNASAAWGKLSVEYEVELMIPCLPPSGPVQAPIEFVSGGGPLTLARPYGPVPVVVLAADEPIIGVNTTATTNQLLLQNLIPNEYYELISRFQGTGLLSGGNWLIPNGAAEASQISIDTATDATGTSMLVRQLIQAANNQVLLQANTVAGTTVTAGIVAAFLNTLGGNAF